MKSFEQPNSVDQDNLENIPKKTQEQETSQKDRELAEAIAEVETITELADALEKLETTPTASSVFMYRTNYLVKILRELDTNLSRFATKNRVLAMIKFNEEHSPDFTREGGLRDKLAEILNAMIQKEEAS